MTNKQRVLNALEGKQVDRCPVTSLYNYLYQLDHFSELTGLPAWKRHEWITLPPKQHLEIFRRMQEAAPLPPQPFYKLLDALRAALAEVARRDAALAGRLAADWLATRPGDPLAGYAQLDAWGFGPEDWLHGRFLAAARFTKEFA